MIIGLALHVLGAIIWVGGMFFAHMVLRPSAGGLEPAVRLLLWSRVLTRFFFWVWLAVAALLLSGFGMISAGLGGFAALGSYIRLMMMVGLLMMAIYVYLYFAPWQRFRRAVAREDWPAAEASIRQIRMLVTINLILGMLTAVIGSSGRYYG
jgi:uncharacterized membrane protein